jgi:CDP-glucose 4,6-dehydratase
MEGVVGMAGPAWTASYQGTRVLVTGHSGFKGTWLSTWLSDLGAEITGFSLPPEDDPANIASSADLRVKEEFGDVRDLERLVSLFDAAQPELVIHMAAQALVRPSYVDPVATISTNVMGTVNVLDAARRTPSVHAIVAVASDKCYENPDDGRAHVESDPMGGSDPYSASKGAAEILTNAYRRSFFSDASAPLLASVRAGNVLGAGDTAQDRILPDVIRMIRSGGPIVLRNPTAVRPWQHVLEPIRAYLLLGASLLNGERSKTGSWNIGPTADGAVTVLDLVSAIIDRWGLEVRIETADDGGPPEATFLRLDTTKARSELGFIPHFGFEDTIGYVVEGYRSQVGGEALGAILHRQISSYMEID